MKPPKWAKWKAVQGGSAYIYWWVGDRQIQAVTDEVNTHPPEEITEADLKNYLTGDFGLTLTLIKRDMENK